MTSPTVKSCYVSLDHYSAYVPIASTVVNLADLFQKWAVLPRMHPEEIAKSPFYSYLRKKPYEECAYLCVPVLGNVWAAFRSCKARNFDNPDSMLRAAQSSLDNAAKASERLKDDESFMTRLIGQEGAEAMKYASGRLKKKEDFVLAVINKGHPHCVEYIDETLQDSEEVFNAALASMGVKNISWFQHISPRLRKEEGVALAAIEKSHHALRYVDKTLQDSEKVVLAALESLRKAGVYSPLLRYASERIRGSKQVISAFLELDEEHLRSTSAKNISEGRLAPSELEWASPELKDNEEFLRPVIKKNGFALRHTSERIQNMEEFINLAHQSIVDSHSYRFAHSKEFAPLCKLDISFWQPPPAYIDYSKHD